MTRVRGFTQDDAHLFVTPDQLAHEIRGCLHLAKTVLSTLGMDDYRVRVSLRDPDSSKYIGEPEDWDKAEETISEKPPRHLEFLTLRNLEKQLSTVPKSISWLRMSLDANGN